jgi:hypothetical protein
LGFGTTAIISLTNANVTLTNLQAARDYITLAGTLTGNINIILPTFIKSWVIINNTTGAFTITVKTSGGTGVAVGQNGAANPSLVYGDGTNIQKIASTAWSNVTGTPTTVAGYGIVDAVQVGANNTFTAVNRFNGVMTYSFTTSGVSVGVHTGGLPEVDWLNTAGATDTKLWIQGASATAMVSSIVNDAGSSVVPWETVTRSGMTVTDITWAATTFHLTGNLVSPTMTGTPTAPTASANTSTTQVATTAFVNPGAVIASNGYEKRPSGLIEQWGTLAGNDPPSGHNTYTITYPLAFPTAVFNIQVTLIDANGASYVPDQLFTLRTPTTTGFTIDHQELIGQIQNITWHWRALGN